MPRIEVAGVCTRTLAVSTSYVDHAVMAAGQLAKKLRISQDFLLSGAPICEILAVLLSQVLPDVR